MDKRSSADIREEINFRTGKLVGEDEERMGIWGDPPQFEDDEDTLVEVDLPDEEAGDDLDPEQEIAQIQAEHEESQLTQMSPQQRSVYRRAQKEMLQAKQAELADAFQQDKIEMAYQLRKYNGTPRGEIINQTLQKFANDFDSNHLGVGLTEEEIKTSPVPHAELFAKWLALPENYPGDYEVYKEMINTLKKAKLSARARDKAMGYDKAEKKASDREIDELADSLFSDEG